MKDWRETLKERREKAAQSAKDEHKSFAHAFGALMGKVGGGIQSALRAISNRHLKRVGRGRYMPHESTRQAERYRRRGYYTNQRTGCMEQVA